MQTKPFFFALALSLVSAWGLQASELLVFSAASLSDAMKELGARYQIQAGKAGCKISFNLAASSLLARQIIEGAPADLFASADEAQMDALEARGLLEPGSGRRLLSNRLAAVARQDSPLKLSSAAGLLGSGVGRIALADPRAVPAGVYAKEYLQRLGLWEGVKAKLIPLDNVRAALRCVESGDADLAIVYQSDLSAGKGIRTLFIVDGPAAPRIAYAFAVVKGPQAAEARAFLDFLSSGEAMAVFERHGFLRP